VAARAGLVIDPGSKVTYNAVEIGRVSSISEITRDGRPAAKLLLDMTPKCVNLIPANVAASVTATTVFGNKYVALTSPKKPAAQSITPSTVIGATSVTTEFNTLFETLTSIAEKVDPVKVNLTLTAAAEALTRLGDKFGAAIVNADAVLDDVNPRMPQAHYDVQRLAALGDTYADAAPDLWDALDHATTTARTLNRQQSDLDAALLAAAALGNTGADVFGRGGPYLARGAPIWLPPASCSTSTVLRSSAPSATTTTSHPRSTPTSGTTATRWGRAHRGPSQGRPARTSTRRTCRGPTPRVDPEGDRAVGRRSLENSGRLRIS
jgi:phospholipid/cholesterol/gamma-HCH transport system substrate-binding protein